MKNPVIHWRYQRYSAIILFFISIWLSFSVLCLNGFNYNEIINWVKSPINYLLLTIFFIVSFFHMRLGMQVVLEDYISNSSCRNRLILIVNVISWLLTAIALLCIVSIVF